MTPDNRHLRYGLPAHPTLTPRRWRAPFNKKGALPQTQTGSAGNERQRRE